MQKKGLLRRSERQKCVDKWVESIFIFAFRLSEKIVSRILTIFDSFARKKLIEARKILIGSNVPVLRNSGLSYTVKHRNLARNVFGSLSQATASWLAVNCFNPEWRLNFRDPSKNLVLNL